MIFFQPSAVRSLCGDEEGGGGGDEVFSRETKGFVLLAALAFALGGAEVLGFFFLKKREIIQYLLILVYL